MRNIWAKCKKIIILKKTIRTAKDHPIGNPYCLKVAMHSK